MAISSSIHRKLKITLLIYQLIAIAKYVIVAFVSSLLAGKLNRWI